MSTASEILEQFEAQYVIIDWDWKEQIPVNLLQHAILTGHLWLYTVDDTHADCYAIVAAKRKLEPHEPQDLYDHWESLVVNEAEEHGS